MRGVSIIICCHNSAGRIVETLKHLWVQQVQGFPFEIVLVDNNCADDTVDRARREWNEAGQPFPLTIVEQRLPGLSGARMKGASTARYEYAVFCDDDNRLAPDYARRALDVMDRNPAIGVLGGNSDAVAVGGLPDWFEEVKGNYAVGAQSEAGSGDVSGRGYLWGAGMVVRKSVLDDMLRRGVTAVLSDRNGIELTTGGDSEICKWYLMLGFSLWCDSELKYTHFLEGHRLSREYYGRMKEKQTEAYRLLLVYDYFSEFSRLSRIERWRGYVTGAFKYLLKRKLSAVEERALCLLLRRKIGNHPVDPGVIGNVSLLLGMKRASGRSCPAR